MSEKMDFAGGKYTVINDNGKLTALRYGEPWGRDEDLVGDNLVYSMLVDSLALKAQRDALLEVAQKYIAWSEAENDHKGTTFWERIEMCREVDELARAAIKAVEEGK